AVSVDRSGVVEGVRQRRGSRSSVSRVARVICEIRHGASRYLGRTHSTDRPRTDRSGARRHDPCRNANLEHRISTERILIIMALLKAAENKAQANVTQKRKRFALYQ